MEEAYLIWSNEHGGWWRAGAMGYTRNILEAGRYIRSSALIICRGAIPGSRGGIPNELPIRVADLVESGILAVPK